MQDDALTRRVFLAGSGAVAGSALLRAGLPAVVAAVQAACSARDDAAEFRTLTRDEAREIVAIAARILPTTNTPGATEAGAVYFFDTAFDTFLLDQADETRRQLAEFVAGVAGAYPGRSAFSELSEAEQDAYLRRRENSPFFQSARFLTLAGVFAMAHYGGNRDDVGWKLVGMDGPPHAWMHPFGYYDADYAAAPPEHASDGE